MPNARKHPAPAQARLVNLGDRRTRLQRRRHITMVPAVVAGISPPCECFGGDLETVMHFAKTKIISGSD